MNMRPTLSNVERMAERLGATIDFPSGTVDAPAGKIWAATFTHSLELEACLDFLDCGRNKRKESAELRESYASVLEDMRYQEEQGEWDDCDDPDCEFDGCPMSEAAAE
jgi:hypothetical protein